MSLVELYRILQQFFTPQEVGRIIQKAVLSKLYAYVIHSEKEVLIKNEDLLFSFKADGLLFINNTFVILEIKTGDSKESLLQRIVKDGVKGVEYCLVRVNEDKITISCANKNLKVFFEEKLGG